MQHTLHWWTVNPKQHKQSILFVHGGPGSHSHYFKHWVSQHQHFSQHFGWISYDQRGCGLSKPHDEYIHDANIDDFLLMLETFADSGINISAIAAHSYGAKLVYDALVNNPKINTKIILLGRSLRADIPAKRNFMMDMILMKLFQKEDYKAIMASTQFDVNDPTSLWEVKLKFKDTLKNRSIRSLFNWSNFDAMEAFEAIKAQCTLTDNDDIFKAVVNSIHQDSSSTPYYDIAKLKQQVLHIMGSNDFLMAGDLFQSEHHDNYTACVFSKSGHYPHFEEPIKFIETVNDFIKS
ncbi:alpha/beta fold hydrolase [Zooshikella harenae]|uniref:Alpha/beta hydrolase n=1 Tax=Zooshikella harenae TaxID=2827238 RepID=A0ABS5ZF83_9GAMM|nr:alpha/beta hydrolase [Zooshikella harenae]MBU2712413.1 alpha/beta hydrolase [Zooshikella harenae]